MPRGEKAKKFSKDYNPMWNEESKKKQIKNRTNTWKERKTYRDVFEALLSATYKQKNGKEMSGVEATAMKVFEKCLKDGDLRAFELIRDTVGEKPVEKVVSADIDTKTVEEVEKLFKKL